MTIKGETTVCSGEEDIAVSLEYLIIFHREIRLVLSNIEPFEITESIIEKFDGV